MIFLKPLSVRPRLFLLFFFWIGAFTSVQAQQFKEISSQQGIDNYCLDEHIMGGGVAFFDYNQDYYPDLFIIGGERRNSLYRNNWDGTFTDVSHLAGIELADKNTVGLAVADIDNDGDEDIFITTAQNQTNVLLENNGDGTFIDISKSAGITEKAWSTSVSFGDFNLDGLIDIYVNNYAAFETFPLSKQNDYCEANFLYQNLGNNQFINVAEELGIADVGCGLAVCFTDCDQDYDMDVYVANDFGLTYEANELYLNTYPKNYFRIADQDMNVQVRINSMGIAIGDYDEDGDFDYYVTNMGDNPFFENNSNRFFQDVAFAKRVNNPEGTSWGTAFLDYNNDSYLDLIVANGQVVAANHQTHENRLYQGSKDWVFEDVSFQMGLADTSRCRGFTMADYDHDGDLDLAFGVVDANAQSDAHTLVYKNDLENVHHWLKVKLQGHNSNRNGFGSHLRIVLGNRNLIREADGGSSYLSPHSTEVHFGLGSAVLVDSLIITWPGGSQDVYENIQSNQNILVVEGQHWIPWDYQQISIEEGDSIYLAGDFQTKGGVYHHITEGRGSTGKKLLITQLNLEPKQIETYKEVQFWIAPNPFQTNTHLQYTLPDDSQVELLVYDISGRLLNTLIKKPQAAGKHNYELEENTILKTPGLYIFKLKVDNEVFVVKGMKF